MHLGHNIIHTSLDVHKACGHLISRILAIQSKRTRANFLQASLKGLLYPKSFHLVIQIIWRWKFNKELKWFNHLLTKGFKLGFVIKAMHLQLFGSNLFSRLSIWSQESKDEILVFDYFQKSFNWSIVWKSIKLGKVNCAEEKVNSWLFKIKIMFLMSNIFNGENLIKKFQEIHQKSRNVQTYLKWKFRVFLLWQVLTLETPTWELDFFKSKPQFKNLLWAFESSYI